MRAAFDQLGVVGFVLWGGVFLAILLGLFFWVRTERRSFIKQDKTSSWLWLRIWYLPILIITGLAVVLPSFAISGMEALAYFYIALFTLGPLVWFGLHVLVGKCLKPAFTRSESLALAMSGLGFIILPALLINTLQSPIFLAVHQLKKLQLTSSAEAPLPFFIEGAQRFSLGEQEIFTQALIAPPDIQINRIDVKIGGEWHDSSTYMRKDYCRNGQDVHLAWFAGAPVQPLKFYWQNAKGQRLQSEYKAPDTVDAAARTFDVQWREDGFDLAVPLPRLSVQLNWHADRDYYMELNPLQQGEDFINDCVMPGYKRVNWQSEGPVMKIQLRMYGNTPEKNLYHVIARPTN